MSSFPPERIKRLRALYTSLAFRVGRKAGKPPNPDGPAVVLELLDEVQRLQAALNHALLNVEDYDKRVALEQALT